MQKVLMKLLTNFPADLSIFLINFDTSSYFVHLKTKNYLNILFPMKE